MQKTFGLREENRIILMRTLMTGGLMLVQPVIVPFWTSLKISNADFVLLKATLLATILLGELPSGIFADRCGRRMTLIVAGMLMATGELTYQLAQGLGGCLIAEVFLGIGISLATGTDQAALYEALYREKREGEFSRTFGKLRTVESIIAACTALLSGSCAKISSALPFQICFLCFLAYTAIASTLRRNSDDVGGVDRCKPEDRGLRQHLMATVSVMLFASLVYGSGPIMKTFSQQFFREHAVDLRLFGFAPAIGMLAGALFAHMAGKYSSRLNESILMFTIALTVLTSFVLFRFESAGIGMIGSALYAGIEVFTTVALSSIIIREVGPNVRATIFSIVGLGSRLSGLVLLYQYSLGKGNSISTAFLICGFSTLAVYLMLIGVRRYFSSQSIA